ncbi:tubulin polymerization-promoting protein homolog isoform X3 [Ornithodoros turicata]
MGTRPPGDRKPGRTALHRCAGDVSSHAENIKMATPPGSPTPGSPQPTASFEAQFKAFAKFGDSKSTGEAITLSNSDKWFKQGKVIDGKKITTTDTGIYFKQVAKTKKALAIKDYEQFLQIIGKNKKVEVEDIKQKLRTCGPPATTRTTPVATGGAVARLTDHTKYTGTHKQRFDDTGKGKGKDGREDPPDESGYVTGYKDQGNYDKTH